VAIGAPSTHFAPLRPRGVGEPRVPDGVAFMLLRASIAGMLLLVAPGPGADGAELVVAGAVSLREPLTAIVREFESRHPQTRVLLTFGASSTLAAQASAGAPLDIFVSADPLLVDRLESQGLVAAGARRNVARNRLVVVAAPGLRAPMQQPEDLVAPGIRRIAMPTAAVPVGRYAREWLAARGLLAAAEQRLVQTEHARATLAAVEAGHADAAVVYATDARTSRVARVAFPVPRAEQPSIVYTAARLVRADPSTDALLAFLAGEEARRHLADAGFEAP